MNWPTAQELDEAGRRALIEHDEQNPSGKVLLFNPCDGWHLIWLMASDAVALAYDKAYTHWMPEPPPPGAPPALRSFTDPVKLPVLWYGRMHPKDGKPFDVRVVGEVIVKGADRLIVYTDDGQLWCVSPGTVERRPG